MVLATLVWTFLLYGGLNHVMFFFPISFRGCACVFLAVVKPFVEST